MKMKKIIRIGLALMLNCILNVKAQTKPPFWDDVQTIKAMIKFMNRQEIRFYLLVVLP